MDAIEKELSDMMRSMGMPAHLKGYPYVKYAILLCVRRPEPINCVTKTLYPAVAEHFGTTAYAVEMAIRRAIDAMWHKGNRETMLLYCGDIIRDRKPTNAEFIAVMAEKLRMQQ